MPLPISSSRALPLPLRLRSALSGAVMLLCAPLALHAHAQDLSVRRYALPPAPLADTLRRFAAESGLSVALPAALVEGKSSAGLKGSYSVEQGFRALLERQGLQALRRADGGWDVRQSRAVTTPPAGATADSADATLPAIEIKASADDDAPGSFAGGQVARASAVGLLGAQDYMSTPFNITSYTADRLESVGAQRLTDVVADDPSVRDTRGVSYYDGFAIRGFPVYASDVSYDGVYGVLPWFGVPTQMAERVEILKGATQLLTGMSPDGTVGGSINLVPKRAGDEPLTRVTFDYQSRSEIGTHVDIGRRFGEDNRWGLRFNGVARHGDQQWDKSDQTFGLGTVGLDYRAPGVRLSADLGYQRNNMTAPISENVLVVPGLDIPKAPRAQSNAQEDWNFIKDRSTFGMVKGDFDLNDQWTLTAAAGGNRMDFLYSQSGQTITDAAGNMDLSPYYYNQRYTTWSGQAGLRGKFVTGALKHTLNVQATRLNTDRGGDAESMPGYSSNLYWPTPVAQTAVFPRLPAYDALPKWSTQQLTSLAVSDSIALLDDHLQVIVGGRQQHVVQIGYDNSIQSNRYSAYRFSPAIAMIGRASSDVSLYANYIEGLSPGAQAGAGTANAGQIFPPYVSRQQEMGVKYDGGAIGGTLSAYEITLPSSYIDALTNTFRVDGQQRNRGIEIQTFGKPIKQLRILGGLAITQGRLVKTADGTYDGNVAPGVPVRQWNLSAEWDTPFASGLTLTGRVINTSRQYYDQANTQSIPSWTRLDLGAKYSFVAANKPVTLRLNVNNVSNRAYWSSANSGVLARGAPRTVLLSASVDL